MVFIVAERVIQRLRVADDPRTELGGEVLVIDGYAADRIVGDRHDVSLART
jgi:hypothetical protein